ncbi:transposase [Actinacidiphila bryophytorum]|uniref:Transposase IS204/IS1001/IS1096/IS1165 DDE domain-containing protein n=2 Tax=Actinacidiphila bryophytorum TaxID=1436133 RepID=A0A9W4MAY9_9ACTN|nr:transposase [Actinacidiphila bryophytorum]MBN6547273.1 transposase [Actinacidiphila bryophytorum]CAG7645437.1 hypothetical protein SBRY_40156 [Actinacidiphila bryophytorum]
MRTRRGKPRLGTRPRHRQTGGVRDRWHTGFTDALGACALLGQVEDRSVADVPAWLATTPLTWRKSTTRVAIDVSATYRAAIRTSLPPTRVAVDHFHVTQLANKMLSAARRRTTAEVRGRRGRATDPKWSARWRLLRSREDLTDEQSRRRGTRRRGTIGQQTLLTTWIAKENLRGLLALAGTGADRNQVDHPRWKFPTWCADSDIP